MEEPKNPPDCGVHRVPREICVLAPWPIFTVTIERDAAGQDSIYLHAGGQGFWVARMIVNLDGHPILCGPFGGEAGVVVQAMAQAEGIELRPIQVRGWNGGYVHDRRGGAREVVAETHSPTLDRHEADDLYDAALTTALRTGVAVLTGVHQPGILPPSFFQRLALDLGENGVSVVADISGEPLKALQGGVSFLKISHEELIEGGYCESAERSDVIAGIRALRSTGARNLLISRADQPAIGLIGERLVQVEPPRFRPLDYRGAGDSMTAGLAVAQARGLNPEDTLRLGAAAGAVNVTRHGLGTGGLEDITAIADRVTIRDLDANGQPIA
ncbi:1-phosphofructokinase family hexose kinase [Dichotomicrobium thermohalophilum]|uniref:Phosphofructokinase n=1 Tax=Dichotomicrobium thermohalophilum TaxID=933063 RepID=A0A397QA06_9HYPH|nr:PfkB family carbohydrate kinase [Dichotomicrobium thermohalophilum]RIA55081.1 1-phosphofructokinase [Dichotomicrobium thermohalophilum]